MSSADARMEKPNKTQPKKGQRILLAAVVLLAGAVVVLIAGVVLMHGEITSLRNTAADFKPPQDKVTENNDKAKSSSLAQRGLTRGQDTTGKLARLPRSPQAGKCELITIPFCQNMPYTMAKYPNLLNHQTQREAKAAIDASKLGRLLKSGCSPDMGPLLCSFFAPPCNGTRNPVPPCKELCKRATRVCRNELKKFGIKLDPAMRCRRLPKESGAQCFNGSWPKNTRATGCKPIMMSQCMKHTKIPPTGNAQFPNFFGHVTERDARRGINQFDGLFNVARKGCSTVLAHFLCPMYAPPCRGSKPVKPPCRELCLQTRTQCRRSIKHIDFQWPTNLKCKNFPRKDEATCYMGPSTEVLVTTIVTPVTRSPWLGRCQVMSIPMCKSAPYNMTEFPNFFRHNTQREASLEIYQFWPLVKINCSAELVVFLCSLYAPLCTKMLDKPPLPCRSLCSRVKSGCEPLMRKYGFTWPESMACEKFPDLLRDDDTVCLNTNRSNVAAVTTQPQLPTRADSCEPLTVSTCSGLHYNKTWVPNLFKHKTQDEVALAINEFNPLIQSNCSSELKMFLCSIYAPSCSPYKTLPCKEFCVRVRRSCLARMRELKLQWPKSCSKLLTKAESPQCISGLPPTQIIKTTTPAVERCEALTTPLCVGLHYNMTRLPNFFNHRTQEEAALEVHQFFPLVKVGCSSHLGQFLCSLYAPPCSGPRKPCRELCNRARQGCSPLMNRFGFTWPQSMSCDKFPPATGNGTNCIGGSPAVQSTATSTTIGQ